MTRPAGPRGGREDAKITEKVVEIDAIDVAEWESGQHTPQAPVAGLAALVRQTAPDPVRIESPAKRRTTQAPPSSARQPAAPQASAPAAPQGAASKARGRPSSTAPAAEAARQVVTTPVVASASPKRLPPEVIQLPLTAPPSGPITAPMPLIPHPLLVESEHRLRAAPDHTPPPPALDSFEPPGRPDAADVHSLRPHLVSRRAIAIAGATTAALVAIIVLATTPGSEPAGRSATSASAAAPVVPPVSDPAGPAPGAHTSPEAEASQPQAAEDAEASGAPTAEVPTAPEAAQPSPSSPPQFDEDRTAPADRAAQAAPADEPPARSIAAIRPPRVRPTPPRGHRKGARAVAVKPAAPEEPDPAEEQPAITRARIAYDEGNRALFAGDSAAAIRAYRQVLGIAPTYAAGFRGLGLAHAQQGDIGAAIMALRTYLSLAPQARDVALIKKRITLLQASAAEHATQR